MVAFAALTLAAVAALLVAEHRGSKSGIWICKPLASTGFLAAAIAAGALAHPYGRIVLLALGLCWLGDVLLIPDDERALGAGISSFLAGHLAFVAAFAIRGIDMRGTIAALALLATPAWVTLRWLRLHLSPSLRRPVVAYVGVIATMVAAAIGTCAIRPDWTILVAALAFFVSDLSVARDRFVAPAFANRAWGLPLYYVAQLSFAANASP